MIDGDVDEFQQSRGDASIRALRVARNAELRHAAHVFTPSSYLRELAVSWGVPAERVSVLPNPTPVLPELRPRDELRAELGLDGPTLAFAGRLTAQKSLDVALVAVAANDGVTFLVVGDGDQRAPLEARAGARVRFLGALPRARVLEVFSAADASLLSSAWENFPHTAVEALAVGTPVIATAVGGVPEVVIDGENGLLVPAGDSDALADAIRRFFSDEALRRACGAPPPLPSSATRRSGSSSSSRSFWPRRRGDEAPRAVRLAEPLPAAARPGARAQVGRARRGARRPCARVRDGGDATFHLDRDHARPRTTRRCRIASRARFVRSVRT